ncbi:YaaA family protein [Brachybacterium hainanense]|uniref:YaaA family protein n=1 Tax=Brachybacterium hainanense TaxID=1541174 RepID=A0ABV6RB78_9MICO
MIIVLPPSESKSRPAEGPPLDLERLSFGQLHEARSTMLRAAARTAHGHEGTTHLGIPASQPELLTRMTQIDQEPVAPVLDVYAGVLYDALGPQRPRREGQVLVTSALLGVVDAATDLIPAYRLSASSRISRLGKAGSWWRKHLAGIGREIAARSPLVVDCRSGAYRTMMPIPGAVEVSAVREDAGRRTVISHDAKRYRGMLAHLLLAHDDAAMTSTAALADLARNGLPAGLDVEIAPEGRTLVVVERV